MKKQKNQPQIDKKPSLWSKKRPYIIIIALINILVFSTTSEFEFVNIDDDVLIYENDLVTDHSIPYSEVWTAKLFGPHYKPLTFLTWKWQYDMFGNNAGPFHTLNWLLHVVNSILVFLIGYQLFTLIFEDQKRRLLLATFLAILFCINPLRLESVAWATERKDVLFSLFYLLGWLSYIHYIKTKKWMFIGLAAIAYLLSGLSKSMAITLIAVLVLTDVWYHRKEWKNIILEKIPFALVFGVLVFLYGFFEGSPGGSETASELSTTGRITTVEFIDNLPYALQLVLSASLRFVLWIVHSLLPFKTSIIYDYDQIFGFFSYAIVLFPLIVVGMLWFTWKRRNVHYPLFWGLLFFGITISPVLVYTESGQAAFLADRYTYIPSIGLFMMVIYLITKWQKDKTKQYIGLAAISGLFLLVSLLNINNWRNSGNLFEQAKDISPYTILGYPNLANYYLQTGQANKAIAVYTEGVSFNPDLDPLYANRGRIYFDQNKDELAIADYNKSISINEDNATAWAGRGAVYARRGESSKALRDLNMAYKIKPDAPNTLRNRAYTYFELEKFDSVAIDLNRMIEISPESKSGEIYHVLAYSLAQTGDHEKAIAAYTKAIELKPNDANYFFNRAASYRALGNDELAQRDINRSREIQAAMSRSNNQLNK